MVFALPNTPNPCFKSTSFSSVKDVFKVKEEKGLKKVAKFIFG
jgi:hypothetical protein